MATSVNGETMMSVVYRAIAISVAQPVYNDGSATCTLIEAAMDGVVSCVRPSEHHAIASEITTGSAH
ncbi:Hypothetical predicted protein [Olea europaea subsp. europaea]|uniref:Uncharacterized protein n=1 Tax=Olea europaea subsp. europaea TaxID=158383 RepID=A0A8S0RXT9_OLEEU|nr:Hypothetical predicted protein [Olea europaea subsp. europaea]